MLTGHARVIQSHLRVIRLSLLFVLISAAGCVDRRFIIECNVPNAQVLINEQPAGAAPAHSSFEYYGYYDFTVIYPGYETCRQRVRVASPWYSYPPFDFAAEILWPFHIRDTRRYFFELHEAPKTRIDELINNADALRERGNNLPIPAQPAPPKTPIELPGQPPPPVPAPGTPVSPQPGPIVPPVGPGPGTMPPPSIIQPGSNIPSVLPPGP